MSGNNAIADEEAVPPRRDGSGESVQDDMKGSGDEAGVTTRTRSDNGDGAGYGGNTDPTPDPELEAALASVNEKKLMRKIDLYLIPWLSILYLASFLDRSAIGNAKLYNMREDLNLEGQQFNIAVSIFFIPYALFEVPSNVLLKRLRPSVWFPLITCLVGVCMLSQGVVSNYSGLVIARFFLGVTEAGLFPGVNFLLSGWYKRSEFGLRAALFFSAATVSGAFGGLLSAAIHNMDGIGGYAGWRWIFILIGLATFLLGVASIWLVQDFPDTAKFLTDGERKVVVHRLSGDQKTSAAGEGFSWWALLKGIVDWKTWVGMLAYMGVDGPLYAFSTFTPSIVQSLGYTSTRANLISVPIYAFACIVTVIIGFVADRKGNRALINMGMISVGIAGYIILAASRVPGLSYFAIYLAAAGIYPCIPNTVALTSTSIEGAYKRSVVMGWIISFGNINGAATTNAYPSNDAPWYTLGHGIVLMYLIIGWLASLVYYLGLRHANARRARGLCDETILADDASNAGVDESTLLKRAAAARREHYDKLRRRSIFGKVQAVYARVGETGGGVFATHAEARAIKGDAYSKFRYSY